MRQKYLRAISFSMYPGMGESSEDVASFSIPLSILIYTTNNER